MYLDKLRLEMLQVGNTVSWYAIANGCMYNDADIFDSEGSQSSGTGISRVNR